MDRQKEVLKYLATVPEATIQDIYDHMPFGYYFNYKKHMGVLLSRMVRNRSIERAKRGVFRIRTKASAIQEPNLFTF